jgi:hypothetical protein
MLNGDPCDLALKSCIVDLRVPAYNSNKQALLVSIELFGRPRSW